MQLKERAGEVVHVVNEKIPKVRVTGGKMTPGG